MQTLGYRVTCLLLLAAFAPQAAGAVVCIGADGHVAYEAPHHEDGGCTGREDSHEPPEGSASPSVADLPSGCTDLAMPAMHASGRQVVPSGAASVPADRLPPYPLLRRARRCCCEAALEAPLSSGHLATLSAVVLLI